MNPWEMFNADGTAIDTQEKMPWEMFNQDGTARDTSAITPEEEKPSLVDTWQRNRDLREAFEKPEEASTEPSLDLIGDHLRTDSLEVDKLNRNLSDAKVSQQTAEATDIVSAVENLHKRYATTGKQLLGFINEDMRLSAEADVKKLQDVIIKELEANNMKAQYVGHQLYIEDENGDLLEVDEPSALQTMIRAQYEVGGAVVGGLIGMGVGTAAGTLAGPAGSFLGNRTGQFIGSAAGGILGSLMGANIDALLNNFDLVNKASSDIIHSKLVDTGQMAIYAEILGVPITMAAGGAIKALARVSDFIADGNRQGAAKMLRTHFNATDDEISQAIDKIEKLGVELQSKRAVDKELEALVLSKPGGEALVAAANIFNPSTSAKISNQVFKRAEDLLKTTENLAADNNLYILKQNLDAYTGEVKNYYRQVKEAPNEFMGDYRFDFNKTGVEPILDSVGSRIEDPALKQRFVNVLTRIEDAAEGRTFNDLIDLRQAVNDIKFNTSKLKFSDSIALDKALKSIDSEISSAVKTHVPNYKVWEDSWAKAKKNYAEMKSLEENVLYKTLSRQGISEDMAVNALNRYIRAGDNTFYEVVSKLPKAVRNRVEGSVLNAITEKYTAGAKGTNRAVHFPQLSNELKKVSWTSPKAAQTVRTIHRMAEVFKNDVNLAKVSGRIEIPKFQSYLTTDPVARLKYEFASSIFNYVKMLGSGDEANNLAMLRLTSKIFENPMDAKATKEFMGKLPMDKREFRERLDFEEQLLQMRNMYYERQQAIKQMFDKDVPPRLVWKADPAKLADVQNPPSRILPTPDEVLYGTARGRVGTNASEVNLSERADDLITEFIWQSTKGAKNDEIVAKAMTYMDDKRYNSIMKNVSQKLQTEDAVANAKRVADSIRSEAGILISRIEKDFGVKLPKEEAEKIVAIKFKEIMEKYNVK